MFGKKEDAFKTVTIQNISDKTIEARAENNKVTQATGDTVQQTNKKKAGIGVKAAYGGIGFSANASADQSNKNVATKKQSFKDKLTFGWNKIPSGESIEFDFYNTKELFYVSIKGYVEDQAFNPNVNILIWNGKTLKRAKELVLQQVEVQVQFDQDGNPVQPPTRTNTINKKNDLEHQSNQVCAQIAWFTAGLGFVSFLMCIIFGLIATILVLPSKHSLKLVENIAYIINPIRKEFVVDDKPKKHWIDECDCCHRYVPQVLWIFPWAFIIIVIEFVLALVNIPAAMIGLPYALYHIKSIQFILFPGDKIVQNRKKIENLCLYGDACGC